jgi:phosphoribosylaminoimidazole-succinocarboxamide synthase
MKSEKGSPIREGKAKILYETQPAGDNIIQYFKDDATAFNAQKRGQIRDKGIINNTISSWIFPYLEKKGIPTHFVEKLSDREMLVRRVDIIPVEMVVRNVATGSITKRLGIKKGTTFEPPLVEFFYKSDELGDPLIGENHIVHFKWATREELDQMVKYSLQVNEHLRRVFGEIGIDLVDFKLEFGRDLTRKCLVLADEFTPDGSRLWDKKTGEPLDKDRFRQDLGRIEESYQDVFNRLKNYFEGRS